MSATAKSAWPALPLAEWNDTYETLHRWVQIVGKTRMAYTPLINHWWNVTLYVVPRGLTTSTIHKDGIAFDVQFDFISHQLLIRTSEGKTADVPLVAMSVASFYSKYLEAMKSVGLEIHIHAAPNEVEDATPFAEDEKHGSYDREYVSRLWRIFLSSQRVLMEYRAQFIGKSSTVHLFFGSFDLSVTRFSGPKTKQAPTGGAPNVPQEVMDEAYSHEEMTVGFWPGARGRFEEPIYFAYIYPAPAGIEAAKIKPAAARFDSTLGEFILPYEAVRTSSSPDETLMEFLTSSYAACADLAKWDRKALERTVVARAGGKVTKS